MSCPDEYEIYKMVSVEINKMIEAITVIDEEARKGDWGIKPEVEDKVTEIGKTNVIIEYLRGRI